MSTETKANVPVTEWAEGVWYHEGLSAYVLMRAGWKRGSGVFKNRITVSVMGDKSVPADELESTAALIADALNVTAQTGLTPRQLAEQRAELIEALRELVEVARLRGEMELPHPADDPKEWTARMQTAWNEADAILTKCQPAEGSAALTKEART